MERRYTVQDYGGWWAVVDGWQRREVAYYRMRSSAKRVADQLNAQHRKHQSLLDPDRKAA